MGKVNVDDLWFPKPFLKRPTFGVRMFVRHYTRRWLKALFRDTKGLTEEYQRKSLELLLAILLYCEEQITSFLDQIVPSCIHACTLMYKKNREVSDRFCQCMRLIGRYAPFESYINSL